jgi:hypothetical protein
MEHFEKEVHQLREEFESFMTHHDQQFESMVKRLEDLAKRAQAPVRAPSALARPPQSSGGKAAPAAQRPPAASVQLPLPKPAPAPAPDVAPAADPGKIEEPLRLAPSAVKPGPEPAAPADSRPAQASPPPDGEPPKPKSRGLVWPGCRGLPPRASPSPSCRRTAWPGCSPPVRFPTRPPGPPGPPS